MSDIVLYGRGKTGQGLSKMVQKLGFSPVFYDDEHGFDEGGSFSQNSLVITSPGVKPNAEGLRLARLSGAQTVSELDFCFPYCKGRCVSVTGTNGKTTTCQLIHHILESCGLPTRLLGNGGVPFSTQVLDMAECETAVLESSSFQLNDAQNFSPYVGVVTNVAPDHLDYHGDFSSYLKAKRNNFCHQKPNAFSVFNADDEAALQLSEDTPAYTLYYSVDNPFANCYYSENSVRLNIGGKSQNYRCSYLSTLARHNLSNALCGILVGAVLGVDLQAACECIADYKFLPHRLQTVGHLGNITFVDDSKATNVHATVSALACYENTPVALILGGSDKGCAFDEIFLKIKGNVKYICAVGQTASKICLTAQKYMTKVQLCNDYVEAVACCYEALRPTGGVVLMSNACASFDQFSGYEQRGNHFVQIVEELCRGAQV